MCENRSLEADSASRNKIVNVIDKNFLVEAGAGSGKTTMLVSRMVAMVEAGIPIKQICAITFTKAAANEFYERFRNMLSERSSPDDKWKDEKRAGQLKKPTDRSREYCEKALKDIDLCFMGTIDSFCQMVLLEHPSEAKIPADSSIIDEKSAAAFFKQQYVRICAGEYDAKYNADLAALAGSFNAFHWNAEEVFLEGISFFMSHLNVHFNYPDPEDVDIDSCFANERREILKALRCLREHPEIAYNKDEDSRNAWKNLDRTYYRLSGTWSYNITAIIMALKYGLSAIRIIPGALDLYGPLISGVFEKNETGSWLESSDTLVNRLIDRLDNLKYSVTMALLDRSAPYIEAEMREKGYMTFFETLYYLRNMLEKDAGGDGKLIKYISERHRYYLIDEFQDTDPIQTEIFFYLAAEDPSVPWSSCKPRPGSLFIVGDPKQSIYHFRGADVSSYINIRNLFDADDLEVLQLNCNFRSANVLCEEFNSWFNVLMPSNTDTQRAFQLIPQADERSDEFTGLFSYTSYLKKLAAQVPEMADPVQLRKIIESLVGHDEFQIRTKDVKGLHNIRYKDIMIITYGKKNLAPIMLEFGKHKIPVRAEGKVLFADNKALSEIVKIYMAVSDPSDTAALYGALNGRLIGLTQKDIYEYKKELEKELNKDKKDNEKIKHANISLNSRYDEITLESAGARLVLDELEKLRTLYQDARNLSPAALFARILEDYRVYETIEADNIEVVYYTLELMRNAEKAGQLITLKDGAAYLAKLMDKYADVEERCLSLKDDRDAVHIANLHKIKGLEAPVVILASSPKFNRSFENRITHGPEGSEGYVFEMKKGFGTDPYCRTSLYSDEEEKEASVVRDEMTRLIYVAATRARNVLIICKSYYKNRKLILMSEWDNLPASGLLPDFFEAISGPLPAVTTPVTPVNAEDLYEEAEETFVFNEENKPKRENPTYSFKKPSQEKKSSKIKDDDDSDEEDIGEEPDEEEKQELPESLNRTLLGTLVHQLMEMLVSSSNKIDVTKAVEEIIGEHYPLEADLSEKKDMRDALLTVADKIRNGGYSQAYGLPKDILSMLICADEVYCEVPFSYSEDPDGKQSIWSGVMDVVCRKGDDWQIIDYKTNAEGEKLNKKYAGQLDAYEKAFKAVTGNDAKAFIYHIDI